MMWYGITNTVVEKVYRYVKLIIASQCIFMGYAMPLCRGGPRELLTRFLFAIFGREEDRRIQQCNISSMYLSLIIDH